MARRKIAEITSIITADLNTVRVYWDAEWSEFRVILNRDQNSTYFCNDKQDALESAERMITDADKKSKERFTTLNVMMVDLVHEV